MVRITKGMLFSWMFVLTGVILLSVIFLQKEIISSEREQFSIKREIKDLDNAYTSIDRSLHIVIDTTIKRAVISVINHLLNETIETNNATYLDNAPYRLEELILNGTLNGNEIALMKNNTITNWTSELENFYKATKNYNISIIRENTSLILDDSFHILFNATFEVNISKPGLASLSRKFIVLERSSVSGFEDLFYLINLTKGMGSRSIRESKYENFGEIILSGNSGNERCYGKTTNNITTSESERKIFVMDDITGNENQANNFCGVIFEDGNNTLLSTAYLKVSSVSNITIGSEVLLLGVEKEAWNISNFINHVSLGYYLNSSIGPSFFDRLEGNNYCSYCSVYNKSVGMESFVNKNILMGLGISVDEDATNIDYLYANKTAGIDIGLDENSTGDLSFRYFRIDNSSIWNYFE